MLHSALTVLLGIQAYDAYLELRDEEELLGLEAVLDAQAEARAQAQVNSAQTFRSSIMCGLQCVCA